jgi:C4-dicarboxylate-specific signal transduction histidine kinase
VTAPPPTLHRLGRDGAILVILAASLLILVTLLAVERRERSDFVERGSAAARAHAATAAANLARLVELIGLVHSLAEGGQLGNAQADGMVVALIGRHLRTIAAEEHFGVRQVAVTDRHGILTWTTVPVAAPLDLSDREHIRVPLGGHAGLFVSAPLVGRASGQPSVQFARALRQQDRTPDGVLIVSIDPAMLATMLRRSLGTAAAGATLARDDGTELVRVPVAAAPPLVPAFPSVMDGWLPPSPGLSVQADALTLFSAVLPVPGAPLHVSVTLDASAECAALAADHWVRRLVVALLVIAPVIPLQLLRLRIRRRAEEEERRRALALAAQAEQSRTELVHFLDALPGAAYQGRITAGGTFECVYVGQAINRLLGSAVDPFQDQRAFAALLDEEAADARDAFLDVVLRSGGEAIEYRFLRPDGHQVWLREHCRVVGEVPGHGAEVVGFISDVTRDREVRISAMAAARLATVGEMATGVAHELNQPAAVIGLAADVAVLEMQAQPPGFLASVERRLAVIQEQIGRLRRIVDHFQLFGRPDAGAPEPVNLATAIEGSLGIVGGALRNAGIEVEVALPPDGPDVMARLIPLEQALVQLLLNAREAIVAHGATPRQVSIGTHPLPGQDALALLIRDTGPGMTEAALERAFEPFFTTRTPGHGTGLGLSVVYSTIKGFGGSIMLANGPAGGLEVRITLPTAPPPPAPRPAGGDMELPDGS